MIDAMFPVNLDEEINEEEEIDEDKIEAIFIIAIYCSLGATITLDDRPAFDEFIKKACSKMGADDNNDKRADMRMCFRNHYYHCFIFSLILHSR